MPYVLAAGKGNSATVMNYVDESAFDKGAFLKQAIEIAQTGKDFEYSLRFEYL